VSVHFSSAHDNWSTPKDVYDKLNKEFQFTDDPCPLNGNGGLDRDWGLRTYVNPPYSQLKAWLKKGYEESLKGKIVVFLIPSRTDTVAWHDYAMRAKEIRFIKGRLKFGDSKNSAPFPSAIVVFQGLL
jgi:site-specific DNA-methyltransferase (adenine-specific)